ncbi:thermonuclease family protein [Niallia nealsonii]|uniref:Nuclease n=1 Tax=Niallia nealsonii TaxID=115979 RepID=A0A2N0Z1N1_9BACI|nr:thermonuclease family protein [Niallia nealsonii]PKG23399.1 nuclease [Niallia nealsonii]
MKNLYRYVVILFIFLVLTSCSLMDSAVEEKSDNKQVNVTLDKAIDGDTISVIYKGNKESVRFLLVDTPETAHPRLGIQPYGKEAKEFTKQLVEDADKLQLEFDIGQNRDKYGRLLAYVYADGEMVQKQLLKKGLARVAYIYDPNTRYVDVFTDIQKEAQKSGIGIWSVENYAQEDGFHKEVITEDSQEEVEKEQGKGCLIKGNITANDKIYHTPDSPWYKQTKAEKMFCTEKEAQAAGFRAPK